MSRIALSVSTRLIGIETIMAEDPYVVLGVSRSASAEEIGKAFRKLAKTLHPDIRPNDAAAAEQFKKVSVAYELLSDAEKRRKFDRGEIDAGGEQRRTYERYTGPGGGGSRTGAAGDADFGFADIFSSVFGDQAGARGPRGPRPTTFAMRGQDVRYTLEVEFLEAILGTRKRVTMPEGGQLDLAVPEGVVDGQVLRLRGKGSAGLRGGEPGDALVEIRVRPHATFKRAADDILCDLAVGLDEAVLGAKIEVATLTGRIQLTIPKGTSSGRVFRLKGRGAKNSTTGVVGDLLFTARIVLPDPIDESLAYVISEWSKKHPYDPRGGGTGTGGG